MSEYFKGPIIEGQTPGERIVQLERQLAEAEAEALHWTDQYRKTERQIAEAVRERDEANAVMLECYNHLAKANNEWIVEDEKLRTLSSLLLTALRELVEEAEALDGVVEQEFASGGWPANKPIGRARAAIAAAEEAGL